MNYPKYHKNSKMSNKTFNMSTDQVDCSIPLPHRDLLVGLSPVSRYSSLSLSPSPDSDSSNLNFSDREADSSPDIHMLEYSLSEGLTMDNQYDINVPQANSFCDRSANLNQTFIATPDNGSASFLNENLSLMSKLQYQTFSKNTVDSSDSAVMSPDSAGRESQPGSDENSRRGSIENDCCSLSSGEMVMRSNSFCLEDQSVLVVSSLDESSVSQVAGCSTLPAYSNLLSTTLPEVCEGSTERVTKVDTGHSCLGKTFVLAEFSSLENISSSNSSIVLPGENEGGVFMTFVCETSPSDCEKVAQIPAAEEEMLLFPGQLAHGQGHPFVSTSSAEQDVDKGIHTSTPVQTIENNILGLPSFSESPCTGISITPGLLPVKQQQFFGTPKQPSAAGLNLFSKLKKREIKNFPKSDFSKVKSKILTRNVHQMPVEGNASQHQQSQANVKNKPTESHRGAATRVSPSKERCRAAVVSTITKMANDAMTQVNSEAANLGATVMQLTGHCTVDEQSNSRASSPCQPLSANNHTVAVRCNNSFAKREHAASSQLADTATENAGNKTFCSSPLEKTPDRKGQPLCKQTTKKGISNKIEVRSGSALGQDNLPTLKPQPRCSSETLSTSFPTREKRTTIRFSTSLTIPKVDNHLGKTKPRKLNCTSRNKQVVQAESANSPAENSKRDFKKIRLVVESSKSAGALLNDSKGRFRGDPSPRQTRGAALSQPPAASPRPANLSTRQKQGTLGRGECKTFKAAETAIIKPKCNTGSLRVHAAGGPFLGTASSASLKPQLNRRQTPQTSTRSSLMGPPPTPTSRLPRKTLGPSKSLAENSVHTELSEGAGSTQVSGGAAQKQTPFRTAVLKARLITSPRKNTKPALPAACKSDTPTNRGPLNFTAGSLKRTVSARLRITSSGPEMLWSPKLSLSNIHVRLTAKGLLRNIQLLSGCRKNTVVFQAVDRPNSRPHPPRQQTSQPTQSNAPPDVVPASVAEGASKRLGTLLAASDRRFEALAIVLQQTLSEREEATRHCRELSQELVNLRGELVCSARSSERLEKEKDELRVALEDTLLKLQEQHQKDLAELEQRLQTFYQAEWDKVQLSYQEEADKCKTLMQQQMGELKANHETIQLEREKNHTEELQCVKQQYETSLEELIIVHSQELQSLDKTLKDAEAALSGRIEELTVENNALIEKLTAEENRRKKMAEKCQKDSHTLYLEQELESLKVVLDIKNKQLHQQEKKLMEVDKLKEKNVKLDESLKKVQQENEDLKARMDRHAALSRQLSTEQAVLQESLQKESKVNKRLSMENEELIWKLHNGDLSSPRKMSPTSSSPSHSFSLQSPRSSGAFSSPPVSPR